MPALTRVAKEPGDRELRYEAANSTIHLSNGALGDPRVVVPMGEWEGSGEDPDNYRYHMKHTIEELEKVAKNGKTWAVRSRAKAVIRKCSGLSPSSTLPLFPLLYFAFPLAGFAAWAGVYRTSLKQRQFTLRSLFVLMTLIAVGLGAAAWLDRTL